VQLAKAFGADVTGVCSTKNVDFARSLSPFVRQQLRPLSATNSTEDLVAVERFIAAGDVIPPIDRRYALDEVPEAIRYLEQGHPPGKVVVTV
jgi:NADPH:quinone reductase-like Zn-dependent oxidoreductase